MLELSGILQYSTFSPYKILPISHQAEEVGKFTWFKKPCLKCHSEPEPALRRRGHLKVSRAVFGRRDVVWVRRAPRYASGSHRASRGHTSRSDLPNQSDQCGGSEAAKLWRNLWENLELWEAYSVTVRRAILAAKYLREKRRSKTKLLLNSFV